MAPPQPQENGDMHDNGNLELPPRHENGNVAMPPRHENGNVALPPRHENGNVALPPRHENGNVALPPRHENGNVALPPRHENGNVALPPRHENGNVALPPRHENGNVALPPWYENGDVELPPEDENGNIELQPGDENELSRVMDYALQEWHPQHMEEDCETDAVFEEELFRFPRGCRCPPGPEYDDQLPEWPLHFQSVKRINNRRYLLQLEKVPFEYSMQKLIVRSLPLSDLGIVVADYLESFENPNGAMRTVYRVMKKDSEDHQYLIRLEITRVTSLHDI